MPRQLLSVFLVLLVGIIPFSKSRADAMSTNSFYMPYVQLLEKEIEYRAFYLPAGKRRQLHKLAYGQSFTDDLAIEVGVLASKERSGEEKYAGFDLELLWQLTEQGKYAYDWGLLIEAEHEQLTRTNELSTNLITTRNWGRWTGASNVQLIYENSETRRNEMEAALALQAGYRLSPQFEPAMEYFVGQNTRTLGPVIKGLVRLPGAAKLRWQTAVLFGLSDSTPPTTWRLQLEYEFY